MKFLALALALVAAPALADTCSLQKLAACKNSNQFFWSAGAKRARPKTEFADALAKFLEGAPKLYVGKTGFSVAEIARESLTGPGDHHDRLPDGGWFFDGFTPHDAPDRGAVFFDANGNITAVALLNSDADTPSSDFSTTVQLRFYAGPTVTRDQRKLTHDWAARDHGGIKATILMRNGDEWVSTSRP